MREIIFRGKDVVNGEWIFGSIIHQTDYYGDRCDRWFILKGDSTYDYDIDYPIEVQKETVGQYTGLIDKNGKKIFEGDICWFYGGNYYSGLWEQNAIVAITDMKDDEQTHYLNNAEYCEVIGNIFDNPELLEGDKT